MSKATPNPTLEIKVQCYAGHRGEETPRCLTIGRRTIEVAEVMDQWLAPDHRYFKLRGSDDAIYLLRHDEGSGAWELVMYERAGGEAKRE